MIRNTILAITLLMLPALSFANDYSIPAVDIDVSITEDGRVKIVERLTYVFDGSFSWADHRLPKEGFSRIDSIQVSESGSDYINLNNEEAGTFSVSESDEAFTIKWYYSASDTSRTFTVSYILEGAIAIGPEWSEFFWNYLSASREKSTDDFNLSFRLPGSVSQDSLYTFTRSKADEFVFNYTVNGYDIAGQSVSRRESARIRTLFPTSLFDGARVDSSNPDLGLSNVLQDEEDYREDLEKQEERDAYYASVTPAVTTILCLLSLLIFVTVYRKYGKRHSTSSLSDRETLVIPGQQPPAVIGRLMTAQQTTSNHLVSTLFNLARSGWFTITEEKKESDGWLSSEETKYRVEMPEREKEPDQSLLKHEEMIVEFAKQRISEGNDTFDELFKGTDSDVSKWYSKWTKQVKQEFDEKKWIDKNSYTGVIINFILQCILLIGSVFLLVNGTPIAITALIFTALATIGSFAIIRRTPEGEETHKRWKAYADGLKNADERTIRMEYLDRHFIYATALHLSKKQIETLLDSTNQSAHSIIPWIILTQGSTSSPASVASSISTLAATGSTSFTGATAAGSGASVGTAGGGASSGAG
jgi:uncharacterized membrane protein